MSNESDNQDYEGLTEEEIAALESDDDTGAEGGDDGSTDDTGNGAVDAGKDDEGASSDDADSGDDNKGGGDGDSGDDDGGAEAGDGQGDVSGDDDAGDGSDDGEGGESAEESAAPPEFSPRLSADAPEDIADQLSAVDTKINEVGEQLSEGDITLGEYHKQMAELNNQRTNLVVQQRQAEFAENNNASTAEQRWTWEQDVFFGEQANQHYKESPAKYAAFNEIIKEVGSDEAYASKDGLTLLREADRRFKEQFGGAPQQQGGQDDGGDNAGKKDASNLRKKEALPKTLGDAPAASQSETGDEFAALDKLDGLELEEALSKMSPEQQERYAQAS